MDAFKQTPYILVEMEAEDGEEEKGGDHSDKSELHKEALSTEVGTQSTHFVIFYALFFGFHTVDIGYAYGYVLQRFR